MWSICRLRKGCGRPGTSSARSWTGGGRSWCSGSTMEGTGRSCWRSGRRRGGCVWRRRRRTSRGTRRSGGTTRGRASSGGTCSRSMTRTGCGCTTSTSGCALCETLRIITFLLFEFRNSWLCACPTKPLLRARWQPACCSPSARLKPSTRAAFAARCPFPTPNVPRLLSGQQLRTVSRLCAGQQPPTARSRSSCLSCVRLSREAAPRPPTPPASSSPPTQKTDLQSLHSHSHSLSKPASLKNLQRTSLFKTRGSPPARPCAPPRPGESLPLSRFTNKTRTAQDR